jgi:hypothetical protein
MSSSKNFFIRNPFLMGIIGRKHQDLRLVFDRLLGFDPIATHYSKPYRMWEETI